MSTAMSITETTYHATRLTYDSERGFAESQRHRRRELHHAGRLRGRRLPSDHPGSRGGHPIARAVIERGALVDLLMGVL